MTDRSPTTAVPNRVEASRLQALAAKLRRLRGTLRYVDYREAERDCELLAAKVLKRYSRAEIERFFFQPIPRGGQIVLGMLSYLLDLRPDQLWCDPSRADPLFVVDDCALSGARFAEVLRRTASSEVVFATLYSPRELRRAVLRQEDRVKLCLAAHDLADHARGNFEGGAEHRAWRRRWGDRLGPDRYWFGQPELICFAWSEPDGVFWNPVTGEVEAGWRMMPPDLCLKNRTRLIEPQRSAPAAQWRVPREVVSGEFDGVLWLVHTGTDEVYSLAAVAADMWRSLAGRGSVDQAVKDLTATYAVDEDAVRRDLEIFVGRLRERGLLERANGRDG